MFFLKIYNKKRISNINIIVNAQNKPHHLVMVFILTLKLLNHL